MGTQYGIAKYTTSSMTANHYLQSLGVFCMLVPMQQCTLVSQGSTLENVDYAVAAKDGSNKHHCFQLQLQTLSCMVRLEAL